MNSAAPIQQQPIDGFQDIYEQYLDEASFLWVLRSAAVNRPDYLPKDILELDRRIDAHLDGLMTAPEQAWQVCEQAVDRGDAGEVFTCSVTAFRSLDVPKIQRAVEAGLSDASVFSGLVSALAWVPGKQCHSWIKRFLTSKNLDHKRLALAVCVERQEDPSDYLTRIVQRQDCMADEALQAQAYKAIGVFKRRDLRFALEEGQRKASASGRFWALWSLSLLGERDAASRLFTIVATPGPLQDHAVQIAFRALPLPMAQQWIMDLLKQKQSERLVIQSVAVVADPRAIPWLVGCMKQPALARIAGEAFTQITGIDLQRYKLTIELPDNIAELPNDDPADSRVDMDDDEYLPWPDADKVAALWQQYGSRYQTGVRYFLGEPVNEERLRDVLKSGNQRHRKAAAMELAMVQQDKTITNVSAKFGGVTA